MCTPRVGVGECRRDEKITTRMCSTTLTQFLSFSHRPATHSPRVGCMCKLVTALWRYSRALCNAFLWSEVTLITAQRKCGSVVHRSGLIFSAESVVWRSSRLTCPTLTTLFWRARIPRNSYARTAESHETFNKDSRYLPIFEPATVITEG